MKPCTDTAIKAKFGDPTEYITDAGGIDPAWEKLILTSIVLPAPLKLSFCDGVAKSMKCHKQMAPIFVRVFDELYSAGLWKKIKWFGGCYCWRVQRTSNKKLSRHSWGIAVDLFCGGDATPSAIVDIFKRNGFIWGGDWKTPDYMHFELGKV